ncbi:hypothetical protein I2I11_07820 [Pontibacter sp. 172403-2]|uniref:hypothetical protein n=1 Tax=Pontibacter rufus TaxID=2791028 RepID=UPI0018AF9B1A|nr:hypothetical protein [Pontibacter sp. 172403-2]MBF9253195.1 hypothetical protein [Pontibacter sp. 172403-2]
MMPKAGLLPARCASARSVIPDFVAGCGMARVLAYLIENDVEMTDEAISSDISCTMKQAPEKAYTQNALKTEFTKTSFEIAPGQLL